MFLAGGRLVTSLRAARSREAGLPWAGRAAVTRAARPPFVSVASRVRCDARDSCGLTPGITCRAADCPPRAGCRPLPPLWSTSKCVSWSRARPAPWEREVAVFARGRGRPEFLPGKCPAQGPAGQPRSARSWPDNVGSERPVPSPVHGSSRAAGGASGKCVCTSLSPGAWPRRRRLPCGAVGVHPVLTAHAAVPSGRQAHGAEDRCPLPAAAEVVCARNSGVW